MSTFSLDCALLSDKGKVRVNNEDNGLLFTPISFVVVADGMGGHNSGEIASKLAVETTLKSYLDLTLNDAQPDNAGQNLSWTCARLEEAVEQANMAIKLDTGPKNKGMGTTLTTAALTGTKVSIAHVGDSRLYLLRNKVLEQKTFDHSLAAEQVRMGLISSEDAIKTSNQNVLTRALGISKYVKVDTFEFDTQPGDVLFLCSDGINKTIKDNEIAVMLAKNKPAADLCSDLITMSNKRGSPDNVTVAIIKVSKKPVDTSMFRLIKIILFSYFVNKPM